MHFKLRVVWAAVLTTTLILFFIVKSIKKPQGEYQNHKRLYYGDTEQDLTIVMQEFEDWENDLPATLDSFLQLWPNTQALVVSDHVPYPPLAFSDHTRTSVRIVSTGFNATRTAEPTTDTLITTTYTLVLPDGARPSPHASPLRLARELDHSGAAFLVIPLQSGPCMNVTFDVKRWTVTLSSLEESEGEGNEGQSNANPNAHHRRQNQQQQQQHQQQARDETGSLPLCPFRSAPVAFFGKTEVFRQLRWLGIRPTGFNLFLQAHVAGLPAKLASDVWSEGVSLYTKAHEHSKHEREENRRQRALLKYYGIKLISGPTGEEWHGCTRNTPRCFGTVIHDTPEYIYQDRWTPPCCLKSLRETARHVFTVLNEARVRYWLEGGSLLGAARSGDIIPWDYDVDVGIVLDDLIKCEPLRIAAETGHFESEGYVWEKAPEGDFYRVQHSALNKLHVDIFPFYEKDGFMTKNTWFESHKQDMPFPAHYLQPLGTISFVGMSVSIPNNHVEFLEMKFDKGVIDHPRYPGRTKG